MLLMLNIPSIKMYITACLVFVVLTGVESHVRLTYPWARTYDLDFLDNSRTKGACGMPAGELTKLYIT